MFPRRKTNTLKQFREDALEEKWHEVREAERLKAIQERTWKKKKPTEMATDKVPYECFTWGKGRS